jgi:hypothetical protein
MSMRSPVARGSTRRTSMEDQEVASVNTDDPEAALYRAERRVLKIQTMLGLGVGRQSGPVDVQQLASWA